jgi:hypothetical protein
MARICLVSRFATSGKFGAEYCNSLVGLSATFENFGWAGTSLVSRSATSGNFGLVGIRLISKSATSGNFGLAIARNCLMSRSAISEDLDYLSFHKSIKARKE